MKTSGKSYGNYKLTTGKEVDANNHIIGINTDLAIFSGYDSKIECNYTSQERAEIADYMIDLWEQWKIADD